ncbi:MAG: HAD-IA family hydrolase, partial [Myxococcota bacterium]
PSRPRALILDFDGTMVDTEWPSYQAWLSIFNDYGVTLTLDEWAGRVGGDGGIDPITRLEQLTGADIDRDSLIARRRAMKAERTRSAPLMPGVLERIDEARSLGWAVAVASSSGSDWVEGHLARLGTLAQIDVVRTRDHVAQVKPSPEVFLLAAAALDVPPERCVVCEDSLNGVRAARAARMMVVAVPNRVTRILDLSAAHFQADSLSALSLASLPETPPP